jgi:hypothetical protein
MKKATGAGPDKRECFKITTKSSRGVFFAVGVMLKHHVYSASKQALAGKQTKTNH